MLPLRESHPRLRISELQEEFQISMEPNWTGFELPFLMLWALVFPSRAWGTESRTRSLAFAWGGTSSGVGQDSGAKDKLWR